VNYYQHHIGDYRRDTSHLSLLEHGIYRQLLDLYYMEEKAIPKETHWVYRRLSAKTQEEQSAVIDVLNDFFELTEDGYSHKRCDDEIEQYHQKAEKNRQNGKKGGRPPKSKPNENQGNTETENPEKPSGLISETETKANETLTNNHKPLTINQLEEKEKKEKANASPSAPPTVKPKSTGTRLSPDFELPDDWIAWALNERSDLAPRDVRTMGDNFKDFWLAKAGAAARKLDWAATWRNWVRNQRAKYPTPQRSAKFDPLGYVNGNVGNGHEIIDI